MSPPVLDISVVKRNGSKEVLTHDKVHKMVAYACEGLSSVYPSQVEMNSGLQFYDGITSKEIQDILIKSAADLITLKSPNYQYVAARLQLSGLVKEVFGEFKYPSISQVLNDNIDRGVYDQAFLTYYTTEEIEQLDKIIDHSRDLNFAFAGLRQVIDKYLVQDRSTGKIFETPQYMYMMIAATLFHNYPKDTRLKYVKRYYDAISLHKISLPTPILGGVRTPIRQFSSCVLIDVGDSLPSIFSSDTAIGVYTAKRAGIGINGGRIRGVGSKIRGGEVEHTGVIPFWKKFASTTRCCTQNGIRGGNSTTSYPIWHYETPDLLVLKNNKGTEDNRIRVMDYCVQMSKLFYQRYMQKGVITLFSPHDVPDLYEAYYAADREKFDRLYEQYERSRSIRKKQVNAVELIDSLITEGFETGRVYIMNVDHVNTHSSYLDPIMMTNLCVEITQPTTPIDHIDDEKGEIALCTLSAVNLGKIVELDDMEDLCDLAVRALDELLDYQDYPVAAARAHAPKRRSLGVGYIGVAHYLAKNKVKYSDPGAWKLMHDTSEAFQYYLLKASNQLAKEKGPCEYFNRTTYSKGILPIDTYKRDIDEFAPTALNYDWEALRADIVQFGLRNSTLSAQMPAESSAVVANETNGVEPPRGYLSVKKSKKTPLKNIVPGYPTLKSHYTLAWDMQGNEGYIKVIAVMQKFFDQSISANQYYNPEQYDNNEVPMSVLRRDFLTSYKYGFKTRYYINVNDKMDTSEEFIVDETEDDCVACKI